MPSNFSLLRHTASQALGHAIDSNVKQTSRTFRITRS